ncbi:MAG: hypothetical protein QNJ20_06190 [Paracoccaceae bacterium]|nr:hypothetical protein [Paracoccaceae bacterium]
METFERDGAKLTLYRDAPDWEGPTMAVAKLRFESVEAGAALLAEVAEHARAQGAAAVIGPMEGDTWHSYRVVAESDGRKPFLMEPTSGAHDLAAFEAVGFERIGGYFSASVPLAEIANAAPPKARDGLTITAWDGSNPEGLFAQVHALSCEAFAGNALYKPIGLGDFLAMYMPVVPMLKQELILFARDDAGALKGFLFGIPNYAEGPQPESAILKTYASLQKGAGHMLSAEFYRAAHGAGYKTAIHALIHDDNLSALRSAANGAEVFRRYALMGRRLG